MMKFMNVVKMKNATYDALKFVAAVLLPASAILYLALAKIWGLPHAMEINATIVAVDTFLGTILHISTINYNKENATTDDSEIVDR